jgi:Na+/H+ antiporter NhaD/arsenite permease-like protein
MLVAGVFMPRYVLAAEVDGRLLSVAWAVPFAGMLFSIAVMPLLMPALWHRHFGKVAAAWAMAFLVPFACVHGLPAATAGFMHALVAEYIPFIALLIALFTVAGGIFVRGNLRGSPTLDTGLLAIGGCLASLMGTTGASMLLLRPVLRANDNRRHSAHVIVFFISS